MTRRGRSKPPCQLSQLQTRMFDLAFFSLLALGLMSRADLHHFVLERGFFLLTVLFTLPSPSQLFIIHPRIA